MSHLGSSDPCKGEKTQSYVSNQPSHGYIGNNVERFNSVAHDGNLTESVIAKELEDVKHRRDQEQYRALGGGSRSTDYLPREPMNPSSAVSHPAAVPSAAAIYPRVALVTQHPRATGPPSHFESYGLPSHVSSNPPPSSGSHHTPVHSQPYRHLLPPHSLLPGQYSNSNSAHIGIDMWQKYNPNPWMLSHYDELRIRDDRERERDSERIERQKEEKAEKERREWHEQERLEREERERAQREAVQQHFEESLRLVLQKQQQQKNVGWNPVSTNKSSVKGRESSPTINMPSNQLSRGLENERLREREKERSSMAENHDKWMAVMQQQRNESSMNISHLQNFAATDSRVRASKQESSLITAHGPPSKSNLAPSPISSSASQMKHETNFSLYGYQPFQHTYITHAQLKAREESKASANLQSVRVQGSSQLKPSLSTKGEKDIVERSHSPGNSHSASHVNQPSKHQVKVLHSSQERSSLMYQPLVGSGGAFKPYEYSSNSSSPAPPAHQNTSPAIAGRMGTSQYQLQDQPQNLVKGDGKAIQERVNSSLKYDPRDKQTVSTASSLPSCFSPPYSSSKSISPAANTTHSLIQQGLVPNPMYIAATHAGSNINSSTPPVSFLSQASSKAPVHSGSPPVSQQYAHVSPNSNSVPVCRPSSVPYTLPHGRTNRSYSPVGPSTALPVNINNNKILSTHDHHLSNRPHMSVQSGSHRSPSPAHLYGSQSNPGAPSSPHQSSPRLTAVSNHPAVHLPVTNTLPSSPFHSNTQSENQDMLTGVPLVKRKLLNDVVPRKRPKSIDDGLLPPQLQPQVQTSNVESSDGMIITPPNLVSNALVLPEHQQAAETLPAKSDSPSPGTSSNLVFKHESTATPPSMPDLCTPSVPPEELELNSGIQNYSNLTKYKIPNKVTTASSSAEENIETSVNMCVPSTSEKSPSPLSGNVENSDERSTASPAVPNSSITPTISTNHTKLKKAWLQRHSENEDKKIPCETSFESKIDPPIKTESEDLVNEISMKSEPYVLLESSICDEVLNESKLRICEDSSSDVSENRTNKSDRTVDDDSSSSESDTDLSSKNGKRKIKGKSKAATPGLKRIKGGSNSDAGTDDQPSPKKDGSKKKGDKSKKRGRKKARHAIMDENSKKKTTPKNISTKPPEKPSVSQLKKTGEPFLQDGPCCEVAPRLPKCRECRMTPNQRNKKMPNIFCRFYAYRKLRYGKNGTILSAGFSEPSDASEEDFKLWLPPVDSLPADIEIETSKFLLTYLGDQFCDLVEMEKEAQKMHMAIDGTVTWKRVVQGVREMCDVCETTLFNIHWVCHKCGFVVCIDCYKFRKNTEAKEDSSSKERDGYQWLMCSNRQPHEQEKLMLTQIIAGTSLWDLSKTLHDIRKKWNIPTYCNCAMNDNDQDSKSSSNGICKLMSAVTKCFSSDKDSSREPNGSDSSRASKRSTKSSVNGLVKQEDGLGGYSSESGGSPLSWLADVALNSSSKVSDDQRDNDDDKSSDGQESCGDVSADSDDDKSENFSTLRELLIRPTGKMGGKNSGSSSSSQKTLTSTLDEVISCVIEQKVRKSDKKHKEKQLLHFTRRYQMSRSGRELPPVRTCFLSESSLLYPEIPHIWLGNGKILLLKDPYHSGNLQLFQEQWKRGQPVIVADVGTKLESSLWNPESFIKEFGDVKGDFLNCLGGTLLPSQPLRKFWEGFENVNKRIKGDDGESLVLKMLDWPPGDEFSDVMPSRYDDFMKVLPLHQYTRREGILNMASRLPECFVQPDLGPRMYNAYGISSSLGKGSTNLHLDVSDAINVLAYVADEHDGNDERITDILKVLDESGCDSLMKKRAKEKGIKTGAIWHVFNARDADKIRDFLNKVSEEQGVKRNPHHDPIHNQEWYLDEKLRNRLFKEYGVEAYSISQCCGDAIFIPAGSPHQVLNLFSCVIVSEDFVSPESVGHSFFLTQEIRNLSESPINHEDKLQIKNIIYHAVKDALALLQSNDPEDSKV